MRFFTFFIVFINIFYLDYGFANNERVIIDGHNVYSPALVMQDSKLKMYFGGWDRAGDTEDGIYRADCAHPHMPCNNIKKVVDPSSNALRSTLQQVNDPSIVLHPSGRYYIMYMTGVRRGRPEDGFDPKNNRIYYSTSWASDGANWSAPQELIAGAWLPSATVNKNGEIVLFANSNINGTVVMYNLGKSGVTVKPPVRIRTNNFINYLNVDVLFRPNLAQGGLYQILAERFPRAGQPNQIDYLTSTDGINWSIGREGVVRPSAGEMSVNTPAPHPQTHGWLYYGSTNRTDSTAYQIFYRPW